MALLHIMDKMLGDKKLIWRADDPDSKTKAIDEFKKKLSMGWLAFKLDPKHPSKGQMIREFDETASKIVLTPPPGGG